MKQNRERVAVEIMKLAKKPTQRTDQGGKGSRWAGDLMQVRQVRDIEYHLLPGTERMTTDIVIERDGVVTVRPPARMTP
jgi:hypothetical protein